MSNGRRLRRPIQRRNALYPPSLWERLADWWYYSVRRWPRL